MMTNSSPWDNLKFDEAGVEETARSFFGKLFQTYSFLSMYANVDGFTYSEPDVPNNERPELDRWILSELNTLVKNVDEAFDNSEPTKAGRYIETFTIDNLSNWFVRLSRKRFWGSSMSKDKLSAYQTLYTCLVTISKLIAPLAPFIADRLYKDLVAVTDKGKDSVHLTDFPVADDKIIDKELEQRMELAQKITSMVLSLRKKEHIIVRQPLQKISIPASDETLKRQIMAMRQLILDEVNVKEIDFVDQDNMLKKRVHPNFRVMGKKYGALMKDIAAAINGMSQDDIKKFEENGTFTFALTGKDVEINLDEVDVVSEDIPGWTVANEGNITVALDLTISEDLRQEGLARELVKHIQNYRKGSGFEITDRIDITIENSEELKDVIKNYSEYISAQVLATSLSIVSANEGELWDFGNFKAKVEIRKSQK